MSKATTMSLQRKTVRSQMKRKRVKIRMGTKTTMMTRRPTMLRKTMKMMAMSFRCNHRLQAIYITIGEKNRAHSS